MQHLSSIARYGIGTSLNKAWITVKNNIFLFAGFAVMFFVVTSILRFFPAGGALSGLFGFIFTAGVFSACRAADDGRSVDFNDFFGWSPRFGRLFLGNLILFVVVLLLLIPAIVGLIAAIGFSALSQVFTDPQNIDAALGKGFVIYCALLAVYIILISVWLFAFPFILQFTDLSYGQALQLSWKIGRNNIGQYIVFIFLALGLSILGVIALIIGLAVTVPLITAVQYYFLRGVLEPADEMLAEPFNHQNF